MVQIIYVSAATKPYTRADLVALLKIARQKNSAVEISGMLLYHGGSFLQVLEGPEEAVDVLAEKIQKDPHHSNFLLLLRKTIEAREFENWSMGFVDTTRIAEEFEGFFDYVASLTSKTVGSTQACSFLKKFQEGAWRRAEQGAAF